MLIINNIVTYEGRIVNENINFLLYNKKQRKFFIVLAIRKIMCYNNEVAGVAKLADAPHSKCGEAIRTGSSPVTGTT